MSLQEIIEAKLKDEDIINDVVDVLNKNINIPFINEKTEAKYIKAILDSIIPVLMKKLFK
tara:strand:- start:250 stop:429 length:180 start_codon:yes stop_codon:yes gene_type:complete